MPAHAPPLFSPTTGPILPIAWPPMVIMVTADPLLPKLGSPPRPPHAEAPPRRARTTLDPPSCPPLSLFSDSLSFGRAGRHHFGSTLRRLR